VEVVLIGVLVKNGIKATFFLTIGQWITGKS
jgi:hypothetical protein